MAENRSALPKNYFVSYLLRDISDLNVVAGVHIQAEHEGIVAHADFARSDIEEVLEGHCAFANVRGIRHAWRNTARIYRLQKSDPHAEAAAMRDHRDRPNHSD